MFTYSNVLNQVKSLTIADQLRLLEDLKKMIQLREEVAEDDEVISAEEIAESEAGWQDYQAGRDRGISSQEIKFKLFGEKN
ncbi:MAG: addiction module protein [Microcoleus sp.]